MSEEGFALVETALYDLANECLINGSFSLDVIFEDGAPVDIKTKVVRHLRGAEIE